MEMLAKSCGLTKATFYYYYPNKDALLLAVIIFVRQQATDTQEQATEKLFTLVYQEKIYAKQLIMD